MNADSDTVNMNTQTLDNIFGPEYNNSTKKQRSFKFKRSPNAGYVATGEPFSPNDTLYGRNVRVNLMPMNTTATTITYADNANGNFTSVNNDDITFLAQGGLKYKTPNTEEIRFRLPKLRMPNKVYLSGRLVTMGGYGSGAEVIYDSSAQLIFSKSLLYLTVQDIMSISIEYADCIYHYHVQNNAAITLDKELKVELVSEIYQ